MVAANSDAHASGEDTLLVEAVFNGALTTGSDGSDKVLFTSETPDEFTGKAWYGATVQGNGVVGVGVADITAAEFSYGVYLLSFITAGSATVKDSYFHHYNQEAVLDFGSDATIDNNDVERGPGIDNDPVGKVGAIGIHVAESFGYVQNNRVFHQMKRGIWADYSSTWCDAPVPPQPTEILRIDGNHVLAIDSLGVAPQGIDVSWACRERNVVVKNNNVQNWNGAGIRVRQSSDASVRCNCIKGNGVGFRHRMDKISLGPEDGPNRLEDCLIKNNSQANVLALDGPDGVWAGLLAGAGSDPSGGSLLQQRDGSTYNWELNGSESGRVDSAEANAWRDFNGEALVHPDSINARNSYWEGLGQNIDVIDFEDGLYVVPCVADETNDCPLLTPPSESSSRVRPPGRGHPVPAIATAGGDEWEVGVLELPRVLSLHPPRPNPTRSPIAFRLELPLEYAGHVAVSIFDVRGRRVRTLVSRGLEAGEHVLTWNLRDDGGQAVASGIYFARMVAGDGRIVRRVVVLN